MKLRSALIWFSCFCLEVILTGPEDEGDCDESPIDDSVNDDSNDA